MLWKKIDILLSILLTENISFGTMTSAKYKIVLISASLLILSHYARSQSNTCNSSQNGNWNTLSSWGCGSIPKDGALSGWSREYIYINHEIYIADNATIDLRDSEVIELVITSGHTLTFRPNAKLLLPENAQITIQNGGTIHAEDANSDNLILMGNSGIAGTDLFSSGTGVWGESCGCYSGDVTGPKTLDKFTSASTLPVALLYFNAESNHTKVQLKWETERETNFNYFEVERSSDNMYFSKLTTVQGMGNDHLPKKYYYNDLTPSEGYTYYRLKMIDFDEKYYYSPVVTISPTLSPSAYIYPKINKSTDQWMLYTSHEFKNATIHFMQMNGKLTKTLFLHSNQNNTLSLHELQPGMYTVTISIDNHQFTDKIIIQ